MSQLPQPQAPAPPSAPMILRIKRKRGTDVPVDALFLQQALAQVEQSAPASAATSLGPSPPGSPSPAPSSAGSPAPTATASSSPSPHLVRIVQARADAHALRRVTKRRSSARLPLSPSTHALPTLADTDAEVHAQQVAEQEQAAQERFASTSPSPSPAASRQTLAAAHEPAQPMASVFRFAETMTSAPRTRAADQEMRKRVTSLQLLRRMEREQGSAPAAAPQQPPRMEVTPPTPRVEVEEGPSAPANPGPRTIVPGAAMARNRIQERLASSLGPGVHRVQSPGSPRIIDIVVSEPRERRRKRRQTPAQAKAQAKGLLPPGKDEVDSLGDVFKQMLIEHLKTKNETIPQDLMADDPEPSSTREVAMPDAEDVSEEDTNSSDSDDDEYVYDIYYSDDTPSRMAAAADGASQVGLLPGAVAGREPVPGVYGDGIQSVATLQVPNLTADDWAVLMEPVRYEQERARGQEGDDEEWWSSDEDYVDEDYVFSRPGATEGEFGFAAPVSTAPEEGVAIGPAEQRVRLARTQRKRPELEEWDQGEDEDSNEEDFYRNEYPEHELDEPGDSSEGGGMSSDSDFGQ